MILAHFYTGRLWSLMILNEKSEQITCLNNALMQYR
jgi:hypothetical protein